MENKFIYLLKKSFTFRFLLFTIILALIASIFMYFSLFTSENPLIDSIEPQIAHKGALIIIKGKHFGNQHASSWVQIGDSIIQSETCDTWKDTKIVFKYPEYQEEALLKVIVQNKKSNATFLANENAIPIVKEKYLARLVPTISSKKKKIAPVGAIIKISGENFGNTRAESQVLFVPKASEALIPQLEQGEDIGATVCSEHDFDFISWADDEIKVRVPDGANSGKIIVKTNNGISEGIPFILRNRIGTKTRENKKSILLASEVTVSEVKASGKNSFFIKVPLPINDFSQKNLQIVSIVPPAFVQNYQDSSIHRLENMVTGKKLNIRQEYSVNTYELITKINPRNIITRSRQNKALYNEYTAAGKFIPADDPVIKETAAKIVRRERNPYNKVKRIYNYFLNEMEIIPSSPVNSGSSPVDALTKKKADTYDTAILFTSLIRACGIPAEALAGIVIDSSQKSFLHWWVQFYVEGFGWVPVDIGMAKGIPFDIGITQKERYYFGNLDAFRVAFSRGEKFQTPMTSNSKNITKDRSYAFSNSWEEFSGLISYKSYWKTPKVITIY